MRWVLPGNWNNSPVTLPDVAPLRSSEANEECELSEFQCEVTQLPAVPFLKQLPSRDEQKNECDDNMRGAVSRFIRASKEAIKLGADESICHCRHEIISHN
ncbi:hypothetical protein HS088_TW08G00268 [Tripterygium wilfordii]|uniref:Uncharacterized protein n=1 Tax=Tripterygium wilfordii TaxID=458696 RepID=A0A7J7DBG8_TRIWF|nr:hypothetical protein HS088_TW08G00268 [Tripterygium wilfordii]